MPSRRRHNHEDEMTSHTDNIATLECSLDQLAALAGVSSRHVRRLLALAETPQTRRGRWALGQALPAIVEGLAGGPAGGDLTRERTRLVALQADRAALQLAREKGQVALLDEVERAWALRNALVQTNIMRVPERAILQLLGETNEPVWKQRLRTELKLALKQAAESPITESDLEDDTANDQNDTESD